jgi:hypothetical protein
MQSSISSENQKDIYILWGLHFSTLKHPNRRSDQNVIEELLVSFSNWLRKFNTAPDGEVKRNCVPVLKFIFNELRAHLTPQRLQMLREEIRVPVDEFMRSLPPEAPPEEFRRRRVVSVDGTNS